MVKDLKMKKTTKNGFYVLQIDDGGKFTYLCCPNCKPYIDKEYKKLKINVKKEEFFTLEQFKKSKSKFHTTSCSYCARPLYFPKTYKPIQKRASKCPKDSVING